MILTTVKPEARRIMCGICALAGQDGDATAEPNTDAYTQHRRTTRVF